jgi:hypothetical protein
MKNIEVIKQLKIFGLAFITQIAFGIIFVVFRDTILYNTDIIFLIGIGSLILSSISLTIVLIITWFISMYKKWKNAK